MIEFQAVLDSTSEQAVSPALHNALQIECNESAMQPKGVQGYSISELMTELGSAKRTVFKYANQLIEVWFWLDESEFRNNGVYTPFALQEMAKLKEMGINAYRELVHDANADKIQEAQSGTRSQPIPTPVEGELLDGLDAGVLARYQHQQKEKTTLPTTRQYFSASDYQNRYSGASNQLAKQQSSEIIFANELLTKFADFVEDSEAWEKAEAEKTQTRERKAATDGMSQALTEFMQKNTAYRAMLEKLESGEIAPQQVMDFLARMQGGAGVSG